MAWVMTQAAEGDTMGRREYGSGGIDQLPSGKWRGRVRTPDGRRVTVTRDTEEALKKELRRVAGKVAGGEPVASTVHTVKSWLAAWLEEARPNLAPRTWDSYDSYVRLYIVPTIGRHKLTALSPEHVNQMARAITDQGLAPSTALKARAILRRALKVAQRYGHVAANVADLTDPPKQRRPERPALTGDQARLVLSTAAGDRLQARYATALYLGLRQGELLGLRWADLDLDAGTLAVRQQMQRLVWRHGCQAARPEHRKKAACGNVRGADCPQRHGGGLTARAPKSDAGRRTIPLPAPLLADLKAHKARQAAERLQAGPLWQEHGLVFTQENGRPIDGAADLRAWRAMLGKAKVPVAGTHAARRTCATLLLEAGVDPKVVSAIIGHTSVALTQDVYQKASLTLLESGTNAIGAALGGNVVPIRPAQAEPQQEVKPVKPEQYWSLTEVRRMLRLNAAQVRELIRRGEIPTTVVRGREVVAESALVAFERMRQAEEATLLGG